MSNLCDNCANFKEKPVEKPYICTFITACGCSREIPMFCKTLPDSYRLPTTRNISLNDYSRDKTGFGRRKFILSASSIWNKASPEYNKATYREELL